MPRLIAICTVFALLGAATPVSAQSFGNNMASFLESRLGKRIGGGECSHLATEALRVSGAEFFPQDLGADSPGAGDYVWGNLVTTIAYANKRWSDSQPTSPCQVGDVIQYRSASFVYSKTLKISFTQHTSVVAAVNAAGRPTHVYEQNVSGKRVVMKNSIDVTKLTAGWIRIYRPKSRVDAPNTWKFTLVNETTASRTYEVVIGTQEVGTLSLGAVNTATGYRVHRLTTDGLVPGLKVQSGGSSLVNTARNYAVLSSGSGTALQVSTQ